MQEIGRNAANVLTVAVIASAVTIMMTAFALSPDSCVDEKVEITTLLTTQYVIPKGTCVTYEESGQRVCRQGASRFPAQHSEGEVYITDLSTTGQVSAVSPSDKEETSE